LRLKKKKDPGSSSVTTEKKAAQIGERGFWPHSNSSRKNWTGEADFEGKCYGRPRKGKSNSTILETAGREKETSEKKHRRNKVQRNGKDFTYLEWSTKRFAVLTLSKNQKKDPPTTQAISLKNGEEKRRRVAWSNRSFKRGETS